MLGFTKALAAELGKEGVRVNAIGPGFIETPLNDKVRASNPEMAKIFIDHTPLGRAGTAEDIVGPAIFLASDLSAYVTRVDRDGGRRVSDGVSATVHTSTSSYAAEPRTSVLYESREEDGVGWS